MESNRKIKVSIVIKRVSDEKSKTLIGKDENVTLQTIEKILKAINSKNDEESVDKLLNVLGASKLSNEVMASALADVNEEDLFNEKIDSIMSIDEIIKFINSL